MRNWIVFTLLLLAPTAPECKVTQGRLFVEFAEDQTLDEFEATAASSVLVVKAVKMWAIDHTGASVSVQGVRFLDKGLHSARACVLEGKTVHQIALTRTDDQWTVR